MLHSTLRLFAIAFEQPITMLFDNAKYLCFEFFCHHRGEFNHYTATALDTTHASMLEDMRYNLREGHSATSPLVVMASDDKGPASRIKHYQARASSRDFVLP
jgi:hypothetical protein